MTISFLAKRRTTTDCPHLVELRLEIAGMIRSVCDNCGRVSVGYVEDHTERAFAVQASASNSASS